MMLCVEYLLTLSQASSSNTMDYELSFDASSPCTLAGLMKKWKIKSNVIPALLQLGVETPSDLPDLELEDVNEFILKVKLKKVEGNRFRKGYQALLSSKVNQMYDASTKELTTRMAAATSEETSLVVSSELWSSGHLSQQDPLSLPQWQIPPTELHLGKRIGAGGGGWVYQGTLGGGDSVKIACKEVISATIDPDDLQEFEHEARMMSQLHHPFLIKFYGVCTKMINNEQTNGNDEQRMYMVTELASGGSLENKIAHAEQMQTLLKTSPLTAIDTSTCTSEIFDGLQMVKWALQIAAGMAHMHSRLFVHRDLKPHNILLNDSGNALICDLGTVKNLTPGAINFERAGNSETSTAASGSEATPPPLPMMTTMTGTPMYMAPESFTSSSYTAAVDVWSYGVVLVRLFTLRTPYPENTTMAELIHGVASNELRPNEVESRILPHPKIKEVIDGCLQFDAKDRFTFIDVVDQLAEILKEMMSPTPISMEQKQQKHSARHIDSRKRTQFKRRLSKEASALMKLLSSVSEIKMSLGGDATVQLTCPEGALSIKPGTNSIANGIKEAKEKGLDVLFLEAGVHVVEGPYVDLTESMTITGAGRGKTIVTGFGFYITGNKEGKVTLKEMTVQKTKGSGLNGYEGMSFLCERMHFDQCGIYGVIVNETKARLINCQITKSKLSGIYSYDKGCVLLEGKATKISSNVTSGDAKYFGLDAAVSSNIHLLVPLTKESITANNLGGGNWGMSDGGIIEQVSNRAVFNLHTVREGSMQTYRSSIDRRMHKRNTRYFALQSHGVLQWWSSKELAKSGKKPRGELFLSVTAGTAAGTAGTDRTIILPVDRNSNDLELELRGFNERTLKTRLVIVLIAPSMEDRVGWLDAILQVMESMT
jgi:serine/threonine protein kinase